MKIEFVIGILFALCGSLSAQTTQPTSKSSQPAKELADKITSSDPAVRAAAVDEVRQQMVRPANIIGPLSQNYLPALRKAGLNQDAADWAMQGILTAPMEPGMLESLYKQRIRALLALNRPDEALAEAKSLYNVCAMHGTGDALVLFAECLQAVHPEDKGVAERFKLEQLVGSTSSPQAGSTSSPQAGAATRPNTQPSTLPVQGNMIKAVKVNGEAYLEVVHSQPLANDTYINLVRRGNLLLEADAMGEARECFEAAYKAAPEKEQAKATENLARVMKAEDGTVGRANAFVLSLRPKPVAAAATGPQTQPVQ